MNAAEQRERDFVMRRDGECVLVKMDPDHVCRRFGHVHSPRKVNQLTVEHVKDFPMMGKRAPSDRYHMVAMCYDANVAVPSKAAREWIRGYLANVNQEDGMEQQKAHTFKLDPEAHRSICACGKPILDPVHQATVVKVQGTARPTKTG